MKGKKKGGGAWNTQPVQNDRSPRGCSDGFDSVLGRSFSCCRWLAAVSGSFTMSFPLFTDQLSERPCGRSSSLSATATNSAPPNPQATVPSTTPAQPSQAKAVVSEVPTPCPLCFKICHIRSASQMSFHTWWGRYSVCCVTRQTRYRVKASSNWNARPKQVGGAPASGTQGWSPALLFMRIQLVTLLGMLCKCLSSWLLLMALGCSYPRLMTLLEYAITWDSQAINKYLLLFWSWLQSFLFGFLLSKIQA